MPVGGLEEKESQFWESQIDRQGDFRDVYSRISALADTWHI